LKQSLAFIHELGIMKVLVTCDDDNVGSIKVIESHGGVLDNLVNFEGGLRRRYWITKGT
jgi:predicted acetyltransferase